MFLDDNKPDYFTEESSPQPEQVPGRHTISFEEKEVVPETKKGRSRWVRMLWWTIVICAVVLGVAFWLRYMNPYATDCRVTRYVTRWKSADWCSKPMKWM